MKAGFPIMKVKTAEIKFPDLENLEYLTYWAETQIKCGFPRQVLCNKLLTSNPFKTIGLSSSLERNLSSIMVERNILGIEWEKQKLIGLAVSAYEQNVKDLFGGSHPYERLRVIYSRYGLYDRAKEICEEFLNLEGHPLGYDREKRIRFAQHIEKLIIKNKKQSYKKGFSLFYDQINEDCEIEEFSIKGKKIPN